MTASTEERGCVVLQAAMGTEYRAVRGLLDSLDDQCELSGRLVSTGRLGSLPVVVLKGGWGKVMAASSCQAALDRFHPDLVVDCGTVGALRRDVGVGDVFVAGTVRDGAMQTDWAATLDAPERLEEFLAVCEPSRRWYQGSLLNLEQTIDSREVRDAWTDRGFDAVAWEPFGVLKTAQVNGVSSLSLRVFSDLADEDVVETFMAHRDLFLKRLVQALGELLEGWMRWSGASSDALVWSHPPRSQANGAQREAHS